MKRHVHFLNRLVLLSAAGCSLAAGQGAVSGKELAAQLSRLDGVTYKTAIHEGDLKASSGNEELAVGAATHAIVPKLGQVDLIEATARARTYAGELLQGKLDGKAALWRLESAATVWVSSGQGLGYYVIHFQPRSSEGMVHDGAVDMLSVVVLFSGEVLKCVKGS